MLTAASLSTLIGRTVSVRFQDLLIACTVVDAKASWGKLRLRVTPESGSGSQWVELDRIHPAPSIAEVVR